MVDSCQSDEVWVHVTLCGAAAAWLYGVLSRAMNTSSATVAVDDAEELDATACRARSPNN